MIGALYCVIESPTNTCVVCACYVRVSDFVNISEASLVPQTLTSCVHSLNGRHGSVPCCHADDPVPSSFVERHFQNESAMTDHHPAAAINLLLRINCGKQKGVVAV